MQIIQPMGIDIGGFFKESHDVKLKSDIWLIPVRIGYGLSDRLDLQLGGTYSTGDTEKTITDYYEIGDKSKERVYSQVVLDGSLGMKYNIQRAKERVPALAFGGELQMGYTVDDEFVDESLEDSFPFMAVLIYMSGSYDINVISLHGGLGMFVSSKSVQSNKRFELPLQFGLDVPFGAFSFVLDYTTFRPFSGVGLKNIVSGGFKYEISSNTTLKASAASIGGFTLSIIVGGNKPDAPISIPSAPSLF